MEIRCNFCVYGSRTIACNACTRDFWTWAVRHTNGRARPTKSGVVPAMSFYEAAARK